MSPPSNPAWRKLQIQHGHQFPNSGLFSNFTRREDGLKFQVTDLVHIWTAAKTSQAELEEEASKTRCSIDPSEDEEQYEVLITKLEEAVSGHNAAKIQFNKNENSTAYFEIDISAPLPPPLGVLEWTFNMVRQDSLVLAQELLTPALRLIEASRRREDELRRKIKEKDHVIGKLIDKIEGSGIDLNIVFPGFAGARKGLSARQAMKAVPGIEAFGEDEWERKVGGEDEGGFRGILDGLRNAATGELVLGRMEESMRDINGGQTRDGKLRVDKQNKEVQQKSAKAVRLEDSDSETSETPDRITDLHSKSSTSDSSPAPTRTRGVSSNLKGPKLGKLEGRKAKPVPVQRDSPSSSPEPHGTTSRELSSASTDTATESESESHIPSTRPKETPPKKLFTKMGIIGGRKPPISSKEKTKSPEPSIQTSATPPSQRKSKLGAIGGRKEKVANPVTAACDHDSTASPTPSPLPMGPASEERAVTDPKAMPKRSVSPPKAEEPLTEAERANLKRIELKRQLDQGKGGKKRRKF